MGGPLSSQEPWTIEPEPKNQVPWFINIIINSYDQKASPGKAEEKKNQDLATRSLGAKKFRRTRSKDLP